MIDSHGSEKADSYDHYIPAREDGPDKLLPTDEEPVGEGGDDTADYDENGEPVSGSEEYAD